MIDVLDWLQSLPHTGLLAAAAVLGFAEGIVGIGIFMPGQPAMLIGALAVGSVAEYLIMWLILTVGGIAGNVVGFELGRRAGPAFRETRFIEKHGARQWDKAAALVRRYGSWAVFFGRLIALLQSFVPPVAGAAGMSYRKFLPPLIVGAACSQALSLSIGIGVIASLAAGGVLAVLVIAIPASVAIFLVVRRRRRKTEPARSLEPELESAD